jgi:hypothetical protein
MLVLPRQVQEPREILPRSALAPVLPISCFLSELNNFHSRRLDWVNLQYVSIRVVSAI